MLSHDLGSHRLDRIFLTSLLLVLVYVLLFFTASRIGLIHGRTPLAFAGAAVTAWGFLRWVLPPQGSPAKPEKQATEASLLVIGLAGAVLFVITAPGYVLPGLDPIMVPTVADALLSHTTTLGVFRPGDSGFTYPPGYPILFSAISELITPLEALLAFKLWSVTLVLLLPVGWAWMAHRVFRVPLPFWQILALSYVAVFGLERSVTFTLEHGKNAQILAGAAFPFLVGLLLIATRKTIGLPFAVAGLVGAILLHYSIIYMVATFFTAYVLVHFPHKREEWATVLRLGTAGILSLGVFALLLRAAFNDPRASGFGLPNPAEGLQRMAAVLLGKYDELLFIFNMQGFSLNLQESGSFPSPYRGMLLVGCMFLSLAVGYLLRSVNEHSFAAARMAGVFSIMLLIGIAFGTGVVQVGITPDFARWYLIFPQAALMLAALCAVVSCARGEGRWAKVARWGLGGIAILATFLATADLARINTVFKSQRISRRGLTDLRDVLIGLTNASPCFLITQSVPIAEGLSTVQSYKPLEYAEFLTGCRILNGSFIQRSVPEGRAMDGLPPAAVLETLPPNAAVFLVVPEPVEDRYRAALPEAEFARQGAQIGPLPVWRLRLGSWTR